MGNSGRAVTLKANSRRIRVTQGVLRRRYHDAHGANTIHPMVLIHTPPRQGTAQHSTRVGGWRLVERRTAAKHSAKRPTSAKTSTCCEERRHREQKALLSPLMQTHASPPLSSPLLSSHLGWSVLSSPCPYSPFDSSPLSTHPMHSNNTGGGSSKSDSGRPYTSPIALSPSTSWAAEA